ncbi:MAG: SDR family NAD(P)-dependent oxidoreductase [Marinilabiliaceae bacterium]|jgi:NADP-dependent 3-hydroxy acid dehydrogenase YdfG|nr:SDR family NAD(P)-dependent oxidoreductase [Marinilabiliaceae bacterium]
MNKIVLVTGATSGIGHSTARIFAKNSYDIIICGRRMERLKHLEEQLLKDNNIRVLSLAFDVRKIDEVENNLGKLPADWKNIDILVNNAGLAVGLNHIDDGVIDDWERMIDTNLKGLLYVTRIISPGMAERGSGHIINIGSIAGKEVYENGAVYCASKHGVDALSRGMRIDLVNHNIKVTNIAPGLVDTEFSLVRFKGDSEKAQVPYKGMQPLSGDDVADVIYYCATLPRHVTINDVVIMPTAQASATVVNRNN